MLDRTNVLGVGVSAVNMDKAQSTIFDWIDSGQRHYICVTGVHGVIESVGSPDLRRIHNAAGMVTPDGMPLAWLLKLAGFRDSDRVCGPELMPNLFISSQQRGDRHFLYGSSPQALELLRARMLELAPDARIVGMYSPPFRPLTPEEDAEIVTTINASQADIVWVGLSTPKQEHWMSSHRDRLSAAVLIGVGAAFDIHAGLVKRAPAILRRTGFEWTYRLFLEPRRLWRRYLSSNPRFVALVALQMAGLYRPSLLPDGPGQAAQKKAGLPHLSHN
jgi:N-acetylglucosaminyldiphosphoundecaprenol N-acetyl-beta-D-mannosaminyltransferase